MITYLASPYSDQDPAVMQDRYEKACFAAGVLIQQGLYIYSPIAHNHPIACRIDLPRTWEFWERYDTEFAMVCGRLIVLMLPGWYKSRGVLAETVLFAERKLPIAHIEYETLQEPDSLSRLWL